MPKRRLIIMRHATAGGTGAGTDHARSLTSKGRAEAEAAGRELAALGWRPDHALVSSATRCRETWAGVAAAFDEAPTATFEDRLYDASPRDIAHVLAGAEPAETVFVLAHNPGVSIISIDLAAGDEAQEESLGGGFSPASFACFEVEAEWPDLSRRSASLLHFVRR